MQTGSPRCPPNLLLLPSGHPVSWDAYAQHRAEAEKKIFMERGREERKVQPTVGGRGAKGCTPAVAGGERARSSGSHCPFASTLPSQEWTQKFFNKPKTALLPSSLSQLLRGREAAPKAEGLCFSHCPPPVTPGWAPLLPQRTSPT